MFVPAMAWLAVLAQRTVSADECRHCDEAVCQCEPQIETQVTGDELRTGVRDSLATKLAGYQGPTSEPDSQSALPQSATEPMGEELQVSSLSQDELSLHASGISQEIPHATRSPSVDAVFTFEQPVRNNRITGENSYDIGWTGEPTPSECACHTQPSGYLGGDWSQGCSCGANGNQFHADGGGGSRIGCVGLIPQWYANGSVLIMNRITKSSNVLMQDTTNPIRQLNADAFDFGWQGGLDLSIKRMRWDEKEFEIRFFGLEEMTASTSVATNGLVEVFSSPPVFAPEVNRIDARYTSDLYGIEANWHFVTYLPFKYLAGFRYLGFDDDLSTTLTTNTNPILYRTVTRNDLYGAQVGIRSVPDCALLDCHWLTWSAKAGIYGNDASQKSIFTGTLGQRADDSADSTAFVGELELGFRYPLTQCFTLVAGYRLLILEQVAVGSDQLEKLNFFDGSGSNDHGNAIFHGASIGITFQH